MHLLPWIPIRVAASGLGDIAPGEILDVHLRIVEARGLHNVQMMGKMDPYINAVVVAPGAQGKVQRTAVAKDQHQTPKFDEKFVLQGGLGEDLNLVAMNTAALGGDVLIGSASVPLVTLVHGQVVDEWVPLRRGDEPAGGGELHVRIQLMHAGDRPISYGAAPAPAVVGGAGATVVPAAVPAPVPAPAPVPVPVVVPTPVVVPVPAPVPAPTPVLVTVVPGPAPAPAPAPHPAVIAGGGHAGSGHPTGAAGAHDGHAAVTTGGGSGGSKKQKQAQGQKKKNKQQQQKKQRSEDEDDDDDEESSGSEDESESESDDDDDDEDDDESSGSDDDESSSSDDE